MKTKTVHQLKQMQDEGVDFQLIDVREPHEYEMVNLGGQLIPLNTIMDALDEIETDKPVIVHCRSGVRSATAIAVWEGLRNFDNLYNLEGGIIAYSMEIDPSLPTY